jgi:hypothetical protein
MNTQPTIDEEGKKALGSRKDIFKNKRRKKKMH